MYTSQKVMLGLVVTGLLSVFTLASASHDDMGENTSHTSIQTERKIQRDAMKVEWKDAIHMRQEHKASIHADARAFHDEYGYISVFFKADLSTGDKVFIQSLVEDFHTEREALFDTMIAAKKSGDVIDKELFMEEFLDLRVTYFAALRVYVDPAKYADYDAFVAARTAMVMKNMAIREERRGGNHKWTKDHDQKDIKERKDSRLDTIVDGIKENIALLSDAALRSILVRVDAALEISSSNISIKQLLEEIKVYIELLLALN